MRESGVGARASGSLLSSLRVEVKFFGLFRSRARHPAAALLPEEDAP